MRQKKLSELLDISIGRTPSRNEPSYWGHGHRWVSIRDLSSKTVTATKEQITDLAVKDARCKIVKRGTLLFSFKLTIGKMAFAGCDLFTNEAIAAFAVKDEKELNREFLYYALQSATYGGSNQAVMGKTLNSKSLAEIEIPLPPINDQIRIAHLLGKVEGLIVQRKQHLQQLDDLLKSVFLEMFGDPVRNEKGWDTQPLGKLATIERGRFSPRPRNDPKFFNGEYPFIQTGDINRSNGRLKNYTQTLNELGAKVSKEFGIGTIVIAIVGATIGETAILQIPVHAPDSVIGITSKSKSKETESVFIEFLLRFWKPVLKARAPEAARANINIETLRPIPVIWPNEPERRSFATIVEKVEALKSRYQQSLSDLESLYGALSQQAFKGELNLSRVPLPDVQSDAEAAEPTEKVETPVEEQLTINLPDTDYLSDALADSTLRQRLLSDWLKNYCQQIGNTSFSASDFFAAAQTRMTELHPDTELELSVDDYDIVKNWVFDALKSGLLQQAQNVTGHDENEDSILGNLIELRAGVQP